MVREMIQYYDLADAGIKARNGFDALHTAAKQRDLDIVKILMEAHSELASMIFLWMFQLLLECYYQFSHTVENEIQWIFCKFPWQCEELDRKDFLL